ncbi:hypothetical protein C343_06081 [Cryptococcus neoformans C23]|uniref:Extracellular membrane protein CFEM domain-containing protein n=3 Tax=Cryptococcus neoformans TaxID=5207 RepID=A0A854Q4C7_CRYNE|nr:hypothetical protein CNAG_01725 [Cryptococcus neoformans var. grubii H99]AUB28005.1 hypothetical protein CKF44_01725 [Cryptococcus neoformans var. grubii]OWZ27693.1 hypothetical protein C347_06120 [Cryptococcus neoformans var. grubii AD2-60a]OWZ32022.1 hypothetical protein C353_05981 [Cryptococcus neoformans var. grubii AD1-83a]OWZ39997.1 hypothetical protein C343_06081 [Cryptococcus neoformans var. grubii C23]OWZ51075.1 hypothetical protein C368_06234 [Cryptococcus neoformans var. grubii 1|eukprot:XP_012052437.1 hypothetical protein CNAG_01725 [Cryptococcus neoformans var. grubii H99]
MLLFTMFKTIALLISSFMLLLPNVWASAAAQYHLDVTKDASSCFLDCHSRIVNTVHLEGASSNSYQWISQNCKYDEWKSLMSHCLPLVCSSAPDVAYAIEYGESFCKKAGIKNVVIQLPESYLEGANGTYFTSEGYLESRAVGELSINKAMTGAAVLGALSFFAL